MTYYLIAGPTKKDGKFFVCRVSKQRGIGRMITKFSLIEATKVAQGMWKRDKKPERKIKYLNTSIPIKGLDY